MPPPRISQPYCCSVFSSTRFASPLSVSRTRFTRPNTPHQSHPSTSTTQSSHLDFLSPLRSQFKFQNQVRHAHHQSEGRANRPRRGAGKRLGAKKAALELVVPNNIIYRQRGTVWHPGENCGVGRDHTIYAKERGYVVYYKIPWRNSVGERKMIGVVFERDQKLPTQPTDGNVRVGRRLRRLGMYERPLVEDSRQAKRKMMAEQNVVAAADSSTPATGAAAAAAAAAAASVTAGTSSIDEAVNNPPATATPSRPHKFHTPPRITPSPRKIYAKILADIVPGRSRKIPAMERAREPITPGNIPEMKQGYMYRESYRSIGRVPERVGYSSKIPMSRQKWLHWRVRKSGGSAIEAERMARLANAGMGKDGKGSKNKEKKAAKAKAKAAGKARGKK